MNSITMFDHINWQKVDKALEESGIDNREVKEIHVQCGVVPEFDEVIVVLKNLKVYRAIYSEMGNVLSKYKLIQEPKEENKNGTDTP